MTFQYISLSFHCEILPGPATHRPNATRTVLPSYKHLPWRDANPWCQSQVSTKIKSQSSESSDKELTLCRFRDSFSICNTCSNRPLITPVLLPLPSGVYQYFLLVMHIWPQCCCWNLRTFFRNLGLTRSDSPSCKMSNTVIQVHGNKQGSLVVSSSPHRQSSKRVKMHQLTKRSHQHRYLTLSPFANVPLLDPKIQTCQHKARMNTPYTTPLGFSWNPQWWYFYIFLTLVGWRPNRYNAVQRSNSFCALRMPEPLTVEAH